MKEVWIGWMEAKKTESLPTPAAIQKTLSRDPSMNKTLFTFWWDKYLPKAIGNNKHWNKEVRYFGRLMDHAPPGDPDKLRVTPSDEAWAALVIENCRTRWPAHMKEKETNRNKIVYGKQPATGARDDVNYIDLAERPEFKGTCTDSTNGQKKCGGWSNEGLQKCVALMALVNVGRAKPTTQNLEQEVLTKLKTDKGITAASWEEHLRSKNPRRADSAPVEEVAGLMDGDEFELFEMEAV